jgi:hypothetical protein
MSINLGAILDKSIDAYGSISVARAERDTARYNAAVETQRAALHNSEAVNPTEAYATGNAPSPAAQSVGNYVNRIPKPLLYGSMGLLGVAILAKALR